MAELQIRRGNRNNSERFFYALNENICYDPSLEPSQQDGSNEGSQCMLLWKTRKIICKLSPLPLLIWSTDVVCV